MADYAPLTPPGLASDEKSSRNVRQFTQIFLGTVQPIKGAITHLTTNSLGGRHVRANSQCSQGYPERLAILPKMLRSFFLTVIRTITASVLTPTLPVEH